MNAIGYLEGYGTGANTLAFSGQLSPGNIFNFGQVSSGQTASKTLTIINQGGTSGSSTLTIRRITTRWPFLSASTCGQTLAIVQTCTVTITYAPLNQFPSSSTTPIPTPDAGVLTIESDALASPTLINLSGSAAPILVASPANTAPLLSYSASQNSLTFAATSVGNASIPQTVTLSNTGTTTLHILSLHIDPDFAVTNGCTAIVPGATSDLTLTFTPTQTGTRIGALEILTDSSSSLDFISLIGAATPSFLTLSPAALDFGAVPVGAPSQLPLQVTNTSTTAATFNSVTATGDYSASLGTCPVTGSTLAPASSCTLQITFTPTQTGTRTGTLSLATSASASPLTAALTGTGAQSHLQITPSTLNFGSIAVGSPAVLSFNLTNTGNAPITNLAFTLPAGDFVITTPCALTTLSPAAGCSVAITFTPSVLGAHSSTLTVTSSAFTSPDQVALTGSGTITGSFTLTANGASTASATVTSGHPATYNLTLTPLNSFSGAVALTCTPVHAADFTTCSLLPSNIPLTGAPQNATATLQTVASINLSRNTPAKPTTKPGRFGSAILSLLTPALFLFWRRPHRSLKPLTTLWTTLLTAAALTTLFATNGCGGGGDPSLRYTTPGTYHTRSPPAPPPAFRSPRP